MSMKGLRVLLRSVIILLCYYYFLYYTTIIQRNICEYNVKMIIASSAHIWLQIHNIAIYVNSGEKKKILRYVLSIGF